MTTIRRHIAVALTLTAAVATALPAGSASAAEARGGDGVPAATAATAAEEQTVYAIERRDGQRVVAIHDMADAASAAELTARLRAQGARIVDAETVDRMRDLVTGTPTTTGCYQYGTANSWCGHVWSYQGFNDPQVYFMDRTPTGYPVQAAVNDWYQYPGIDAYYRWYTESVPSGRHYVSVRTYTPASSGEYGETAWNYGTQGPVTVSISTRIKGTTQARKTTCHEIGHALGLDHNDSTNSCLVQGQWQSGESYRPSSQDGRVLLMVYPKSGT